MLSLSNPHNNVVSTQKNRDDKSHGVIVALVKATFHLMVSTRGQRSKGKIQRNNYHYGNCRPSLTGKTSSVSLIFTHWTDRNAKNR